MSEEIVKPQTTGTALAQASISDSQFDKIESLLTAAEKIGTFMAAAGMCGGNKCAAVTLAFHSFLERKSPIEMTRRYHIMFGNLAMKSERMLAEFMKRPGNKWEWVHFGDDGSEASAKVTTPRQSIVVTYSSADDKKAGLAGKENHQKYTGAMLRARLVTKAIRMLDPDVLDGFVSDEEAAEVTPRLELNSQVASAPVVTAPAPETAKIVEAVVMETPSPVAAKVAHEMKERAEQPLPADIQPPQAQATVGILTTPALPLAETPKPAAAVTSAMPLATQQWLADWCKPVGVIAATEFMRAKEWLPKDGNIEDLSESFVALIKKKPVVVLNQIKAFTAKQSSQA